MEIAPLLSVPVRLLYRPTILGITQPGIFADGGDAMGVVGRASNTEMFFQIRAESFGPVLERVFQRAGDDGRGTGTLSHSEQ